jgi:hypothetical protein
MEISIFKIDKSYCVTAKTISKTKLAAVRLWTKNGNHTKLFNKISRILESYNYYLHNFSFSFEQDRKDIHLKISFFSDRNLDQEAISIYENILNEHLNFKEIEPEKKDLTNFDFLDFEIELQDFKYKSHEQNVFTFKKILSTIDDDFSKEDIIKLIYAGTQVLSSLGEQNEISIILDCIKNRHKKLASA